MAQETVPSGAGGLEGALGIPKKIRRRKGHRLPQRGAILGPADDAVELNVSGKRGFPIRRERHFWLNPGPTLS